MLEVDFKSVCVCIGCADVVQWDDRAVSRCETTPRSARMYAMGPGGETLLFELKADDYIRGSYHPPAGCFSIVLRDPEGEGLHKLDTLKLTPFGPEQPA